MATYTVKKGDTLSGIGKQFGVNYMDIAKANGISNPNLIYEGQTLTIGEPSTGDDSQTTPETETPSFEYKEYTPSDAVTQAEEMLKQQMGKKPGDYTSLWGDQLTAILDKILNREDFSYDLNGDALYQQYKDQYTTQGKLAMMDTMGQAAALTGGYGSSYAQTAGQQAYQGYLQGLNDKIPELYQLALSKYNADGDALRDQASLLAQMDDRDYGRYRDQLTDYYTELDRLTDESRYQAEQDYGKWSDDMSFRYQMDRDKTSDEQWQAQFDEAVRQFDESNKKTNSSGGGSGGSSSSSSSKKKTSNDTSSKKEDTKTQQTSGFTGSTYSEACAYLKANGKSSSGLMTQSEWTRHKNKNNSAGGEHEASSYKEYLAAYIYGQMN